ncbi:MAG: stage V sporulation protein D, partial [Clostridia bacterium]|nr:stage V sporulation protein D [Clostridia bacterium]
MAPIRHPSESNRRIPGRSMIILLGFMILWCILILRLFDLQIINYDYYQNKVLNNVQRMTTLSAVRGEIYDSGMNKLASNYTVYRIFISPRDIENDEQALLISKGLSDILGVDYDKILTLTKKVHRADETIKKKASEEEADTVRKFILDNDLKMQIHLEASTARYYPFSSLASNVIGVVGTDGGLTGLEYQYNSFLMGESGKYISSKDAQGGQMPSKYDTYIDASNGANLVTTINTTIQKALEKQLQQTYLDSDPLNRVTGIVMDVNTGAVLAMGTYPTFDLNSPFTLDEDSIEKLEASELSPDSTEYAKYQTELLYQLWRNKAVSELYEPGSTFKIVTTAMALEEGLVSLDENFYCSGKYYVEGYPYPIHCHKTTGHGSVSFERGLQQSCNPILMSIGLRIGQQNFYKYFEAFGYTGYTGIDLPGEAKSIYSSYNNFGLVSLAVYSFGQTFKVTPLMQLSAISSVANGG